MPGVVAWFCLQLFGTAMYLAGFPRYYPLQVISSAVMLYVVCSFWRLGLNNHPGLQRLFTGMLLIALAVVIIGVAFVATRETPAPFVLENWFGRWYMGMISS